MGEDEENALIAEQKMPRPHARALRVALRQVRAEQQALASSSLHAQMNAPLLVAAEPILVHAAAVHQPHRRDRHTREHVRSGAGRGGSGSSHGTTSVGCSKHCTYWCTEQCSCRWSRCTAGRFCQALLLLLAVATALAFAYMDVCGDSWADTGQAPSWCWPRPHHPSQICDGLDSPTGIEPASARCGSYCCGEAYGSQCGHFTLHAPMAAMRFDLNPDATVGANVTFSGGSSVSCEDPLKGQTWKYYARTQRVKVDSTCLATFWRAEKLDPPTVTYDKRGNSLSLDFSSHSGAAGLPSGHGVMLRVCPRPKPPPPAMREHKSSSG
jgi:hypothetical protein